MFLYNAGIAYFQFSLKYFVTLSENSVRGYTENKCYNIQYKVKSGLYRIKRSLMFRKSYGCRNNAIKIEQLRGKLGNLKRIDYVTQSELNNVK